MSERINTPFTNEHFVAFCEKMVGQPYWYGSVVYKCTENLRARKAKQYPAHYGSSRTTRYRDDIAKKKVCAPALPARLPAARPRECPARAWRPGGP